MDDVAIARALHVLAVVIWIGGVAMVTMVVLPAGRRRSCAARRPPNRRSLRRARRAWSWPSRSPPKCQLLLYSRSPNISRRLLDQLEADDVVMVTRLDRLARSTRDLLNVLATITGKKAGFRSLGDTWADTTTSHGRLMLTVLGGLAEFERDLIRARTGEGRERAKARGVKMGRRPKLTPHQQAEGIKRREAGEPIREIARTYNVHNSTISRLTL
jgi:hypothetical protein